MLLRFTVKNFLSFKDETVFEMFPSNKRDKKGLLHSKEGKEVYALPLAAIYGHNASGKSNFVEAISFARGLIIYGTKPNEQLGVKQFLLDETSIKEPSIFEFVMKIENVVYTYGFALTNEQILEEWFYGVFSRGESLLFERVTKANKSDMKIGPKFANKKSEKDFIKFIAKSTRPNQLYITEAFEKNVEQILPLVNWLGESLQTITPTAIYSDLFMRSFTDETFVAFLDEFLTKADIGITGISKTSKSLDLNNDFIDLNNDLGDRIKRAISTLKPDEVELFDIEGKPQTIIVVNNGEIFQMSFKLKHKSNTKNQPEFEIDQESDGTIRMMHLIPVLVKLQKQGKVIFIDEIERSLHPDLCQYFVEQYLAGVEDGIINGQLIFTTHLRNLMNIDEIRNDEIWFVEKDEFGSSELYSLDEFKIRSDLDRQKGYINGRFGAVPILNDM